MLLVTCITRLLKITGLVINRQGLQIALLCALIACVVLAAAVGDAHRQLGLPISLTGLAIAASMAEAAPMPMPNPARYQWPIKRGSSLSQVVRQLGEAGVIKSPLALKIYAKIVAKTTIQTGSYWLETSDSALTLLDKFNRGEVIVKRLTFPEGWNFSQWRQHLEGVPQFADSRHLSDVQLLQTLGLDISHPEGWFFPDTYSYTGGDSIADLLLRAHRKMLDTLDKAWLLKAKDLPYSSAYEALIMASIVEKETGLAAERAAIAGVFVRRLRLGMRLQTDPTVIYGLGNQFSGNLRRSHLKQKTAYNTYVIGGLPPTPIAMPSAAAIYAALHPADGGSLYFVARGDGGHYFSSTLEQHRRAVRKYQIFRRAKNYTSTPQ
jgi:UPF0755 protein